MSNEQDVTFKSQPPKGFENNVIAGCEVIRNLAPELPRYSLHTWLNPTVPVTRERLKLCLAGIAIRSGGELFAGPLSVDAEGTEGIDKKYLRPDFTAADRQVMTWWTDKNAQNVKNLPAWSGGVMPHSHGVIYYYPKHSLIDVFIETCMKFDPEPVNGFLDVYWQPEAKRMQTEFRIITTGIPVDRSPGARKKVGELYTILGHLGPRNRDETLRDGKRLEQIILHWEEKKDGLLDGYFTLEENIAMQELYAFYEGELEISTAERIISGEVSDETAFGPYDRYKRLIDEEMKRGDIDKDTRVAFVGGGWFPISAILYARSGARVTVFEKEKDRAEIAQQVIEKLGLSDTIKIVCASVEQVELNPFNHDVYVIAAMARPKDIILKSLPDDDLDNVIVRTAFRQRNYLYEELQGLVDNRFIPIDHHEAEDPDDILSFVVVTMVPTDMGADKKEWKSLVRNKIHAHGDKVYKPSSLESIFRSTMMVPESYPLSS